MSRAAIEDLLQAVPLFSGLFSERFEMLARSPQSVLVKKRVLAFEEAAQAYCCFVLLSALTRATLGGGDTEIVLGAVNPNRLVGEVAPFDQSMRSAPLVTVTSCRFIRIRIRIPTASFDALRKSLCSKTESS